MLSKQLGLSVHQLRRLRFQRFGDLRVQLQARASKQTVMRCVLHQRVLEAIDRIRWCAALED